MKRILLIMGNHSPNPSSVANCAEPLINSLKNAGFKIDIVTNRKTADALAYERIDSADIYRVDDFRAINTDALNRKAKADTSKARKYFARITAFISKACYYARYCLLSREKGTGGWEAGRIAKKCAELHKKHEYAAVISFSLPFKAHYAARRLVRETGGALKWFMYEYDPFSFNKRIKAGKIMRRIMYRDEYAMFGECDKIFLTPELYKFYMNTSFSVFSEKFISIPFANLKKIDFEADAALNIQFEKDKINCLFTGQLYNDIRNPQFAFKLFSLTGDDIHFNLITNYMIGQVDKGLPDIEGKFTFYPLQPRNVAQAALMKADILVNIGNTVEFQVPGKIFEYMGCGKPIIHFSKIPEDPALIYLLKYPGVIIIKEWEGGTEEQAARLESFCRRYKGSCLSYEEVCSALEGLDSESVSLRFVKIISDMLGAE